MGRSEERENVKSLSTVRAMRDCIIRGGLKASFEISFGFKD